MPLPPHAPLPFTGARATLPLRYVNAFFIFYLLLYVLGQRFVRVYMVAAWLDALCQLTMCFTLSNEDRMDLAAE